MATKKISQAEMKQAKKLGMLNDSEVKEFTKNQQLQEIKKFVLIEINQLDIKIDKDKLN